MQQSYICTNCYHVSAGKMSGSILLELALWLICFPVGIWYSLYRSKHRHGDCPQCKGSKTMIPAATPRGQELLQKAGLDLPASCTPATGNTPSVPLYGSQKPKSRKAYWIVGGFVGLVALNTMIDASKQQGIEPGANLGIQGAMVERRTAAVAAYQKNSAAVIAEIDQLLRKNDFQLARQKLDMLADINDDHLKSLRERTGTGLRRLAQQQAQRQEADHVATQRQQALIGQALSECKSAIANHLGADGSGMIPDVKNFGSGNEFVFGWPKGSFQMHTAVGSVDMSASCDGTLRPVRIMSLSVNGQTIIINGR